MIWFTGSSYSTSKMAWFSGKVSLGGFPDLAGAVNKLSESVKNIEKNFDSALGLEEKSESTSSNNEYRKALFDPVMAFMGHKDVEDTTEALEKSESSQPSSASIVEDKEYSKLHESNESVVEQSVPADEVKEETSDAVVHSASIDETQISTGDIKDTAEVERTEGSAGFPPSPAKFSEPKTQDIGEENLSKNLQKEISEEPLKEKMEDPLKESLKGDKQETLEESSEKLESLESKPTSPMDQSGDRVMTELDNVGGLPETASELEMPGEVINDVSSIQAEDVITDTLHKKEESSISNSLTSTETGNMEEHSTSNSSIKQQGISQMVSESNSYGNNLVAEAVEITTKTGETDIKALSSSSNPQDIAGSIAELEKVRMEMKMMERAIQGAARQAQAKADEISKLMNENEQLKSMIEDLRRKSNDAEIESLREEYHQRVATLERKVYALTRERDTLRREQSKKSDAAALLKEKDEIITQVMAEGEQLSKKQAAQESQIRKLRAQIRELEEEKKGLLTKLEVEENKVESIKKDKAATEKLLQESIEKHQSELAIQKEYYTNALSAAKEAEALAEARANNEARTELESHLREIQEREAMLVQALEELRQTLSRKEQQAVFREDMLQRDIEDLQKRYQATERRCEELISQVPESTRPLLRQIEAMQETTARKAEAWAAVERSLNSRLQEEEAKAAAAEERERSINERLSQTLSRINVLEAQISCLRAEQTQLTRSLEKERQRAAENRQDFLALKEEADTNEGRVKQLEEEIRELRRKHKQELQEAMTKQELLQQELEKEKAARLDQERTLRLQSSGPSDQSTLKPQKSIENGNMTRRLSSASSLSSMEESYFLQASLDSSDNLSERRNVGEGGLSPFYVKSMTPNAFEAALRQKEGELASYMSRLASMESIRDSLAEELVKMTAQCEKLRVEAALLPGLRAELEALRRRHSAALELMGERDEELEELRADIVDLKEMYREQVNMLVNKIQVMSSSMVAA